MPKPSSAARSTSPPTSASSPTAISPSKLCRLADTHDPEKCAAVFRKDHAQTMMTSAYTFRPMTSADLPMVARWLRTPEVVRWWGDPDEHYELVSGDLTHPDMDQFIVAHDERPFAYIQCYRLSAWNQG